MTEIPCGMFFQEHFSFWLNLSQSEQDRLCASAATARYKKGETLYSGAADCLGVILIKTGRLRVYILSEDGREITLYRLTDGDTCIFSASCVLDAIAFPVFIEAETDTELFVIPSPLFHELAEQNLSVEVYAYKLAAARFSEVLWAMQQILFMGVDKRLAIFLNEQLKKENQNVIAFTHEQVAKSIGTAREVVSRMLKYFEREQILSLRRGAIEITNKEKLKALF